MATLVKEKRKEDKRRTSIYLSEENYRKLKRISYETDIPRTIIVEKLVEKYADDFIEGEKKPIGIMSKEEADELRPIFEKYEKEGSITLSKDFRNSETGEWETEYFNSDDGKWYNSKEVDTYWDDELDKLIVVKKV